MGYSKATTTGTSSKAQANRRDLCDEEGMSEGSTGLQAGVVLSQVIRRSELDCAGCTYKVRAGGVRLSGVSFTLEVVRFSA